MSLAQGHLGAKAMPRPKILTFGSSTVNLIVNDEIQVNTAMFLWEILPVDGKLYTVTLPDSCPNNT